MMTGSETKLQKNKSKNKSKNKRKNKSKNKSKKLEVGGRRPERLYTFLIAL